MAKVTAAQKSILEVMANGETIFKDYRGMHLLGNKTVSITTLNSLLDARLIQYEKMVRGVQTYSITEAGRSIVTPIAEPIVETTPIVEIVETAADVERTSELVATIAANLNTDDINPTFDIGNGNVAKASKWFCEERAQLIFSIGYYEEGLGLVNADEFATFGNLIVGMERLSGDLGLWHISEE